MCKGLYHAKYLSEYGKGLLEGFSDLLKKNEYGCKYIS
jgi:hypothetical protein